MDLCDLPRGRGRVASLGTAGGVVRGMAMVVKAVSGRGRRGLVLRDRGRGVRVRVLLLVVGADPLGRIVMTLSRLVRVLVMLG